MEEDKNAFNLFDEASRSGSESESEANPYAADDSDDNSMVDDIDSGDLDESKVVLKSPSCNVDIELAKKNIQHGSSLLSQS